MRKICGAFLLLSCLSGAAYAQGQAPKLVEYAAQCLAAKKQIAISQATPLSFGYLIDTKSYPGKKVLYVVVTSGSNRSAGKAFAIFYRAIRHRWLLDIQNGATFLRSNDGPQGIDFVAPPIGGPGAEGQFRNAIQQIEGQPMVIIADAVILAPPAHLQCDSYSEQP